MCLLNQWPSLAPQRIPAGASRLQSTRPVRRVAELGSLDLVHVAVPLALLLTFAASVDALEFAYYTSLRNESGKSIEVTPDVIGGRSHYTVQPGRTYFLGGFSTERFMVRTPKHVLDYKFPLTFGAEPHTKDGREIRMFSLATT